MAKPQEKLASIEEKTPLTEDDNFPEEDDQCYEEAAVNTCGCFGKLCFTWKRSNKNGGTGRYLLHEQQQQEGEKREGWLKKRLKKVEEISEALAGPKWKTFIRRFSNGVNGMNKKTRKSHMQFQYDPQSYKLNFDDGSHYINFLARYTAPVVVINKGELTGGEATG